MISAWDSLPWLVKLAVYVWACLVLIMAAIAIILSLVAFGLLVAAQ